MNRSRILILGVAVAAAIGAGYMAKNLTAPTQEVVVSAPPEPQIELKDVLVLTRDVPMGEMVADAARWQQWPADAVTETLITREGNPEALDELRNSVARVTLYEGEPLRGTKLINAGESFMSAILPPGKRAVATRIAADTSAGGFILPNDRVDVIMTRRSENSATAEGFVTETVLENIRVLAIDQTIQEDDQGRLVQVGETATLELTPEQAEVITVAQQLADRLTLALRSVADSSDDSETDGLYLVTGAGQGNAIRVFRSGEMNIEGTRR